MSFKKEQKRRNEVQSRINLSVAQNMISQLTSITKLAKRIGDIEQRQREDANVIGFLLKKAKLETVIVSSDEYNRNRKFFKDCEFVTALGDFEVLLVKKVK